MKNLFHPHFFRAFDLLTIGEKRRIFQQAEKPVPRVAPTAQNSADPAAAAKQERAESQWTIFEAREVQDNNKALIEALRPATKDGKISFPNGKTADVVENNDAETVGNIQKVLNVLKRDGSPDKISGPRTIRAVEIAFRVPPTGNIKNPALTRAIEKAAGIKAPTQELPTGTQAARAPGVNKAQATEATRAPEATPAAGKREKNPERVPQSAFLRQVEPLLAQIPESERKAFEKVLPQIAQADRSSQQNFIVGLQNLARTWEQAKKRGDDPSIVAGKPAPEKVLGKGRIAPNAPAMTGAQATVAEGAPAVAKAPDATLTGVNRYLFPVDSNTGKIAMDRARGFANSIISTAEAKSSTPPISTRYLRYLNGDIQKIYDNNKGFVSGTLGGLANQMSGDEVDPGRTDFINQESTKMANKTVIILEKNPDAPNAYDVYSNVYRFLAEKNGLHYANLFRSQCLASEAIKKSQLFSQISSQEVVGIQKHSPQTVVWFNQQSQQIQVFQPKPGGGRTLIDSVDARGGNRTAPEKTKESGLFDQTRTPDGVHTLAFAGKHTTERYRAAWIAGDSELKIENSVVFHKPPNTSKWFPATGENATFFIKGRSVGVGSLELQMQVAGGKPQLEEKIKKDGVLITGNINTDFNSWKTQYPNSLVRFTPNDFSGLLNENGVGKYSNRNPFGDAPAIAIGNTGTYIHQKVLAAPEGKKYWIQKAFHPTSGEERQDLNDEYAKSGGAIYESSHGCITTFDSNFDRISGYIANGAKVIITSNPEQEKKYLG